MLVRVIAVVVGLWGAVTFGASGQEASLAAHGAVSGAQYDAEDLQSLAEVEERALSELDSGSVIVLSPVHARSDIRFTLPPRASAEEAWLTLAARPASDSADGVIEVSINGGEPIAIRPQPRPMEARFALYSADLVPGENTLSITYRAQSVSAGWIVDARRSNLRLTLDAAAAPADLDELEQALGADFAAPRRIALLTDISRKRATYEGLTVQGLSLRAGRVPNFSDDEAGADLAVRIAPQDRLSEADRALLAAAGGEHGPAVIYSAAPQPRLIVTGRNLDEAAAAARLLAARSFAGFGDSFLASDAVQARRLGQPFARDARRQVGEDADLRTLATSGLPFSADQGARTAVLFAAARPEDRYGALSILARASLTTGQAWLYAWYGDADDAAPADHDLLVIGSDGQVADRVQAAAPAEWRHAMRAAERSRGQRGVMRFAAAAYADDENGGPGLGVATMFRDQADMRWIAALSAPRTASFESAGRSLARSELWTALEGRAAVWSDRGVTSYDFRVSQLALSDRALEFLNDHARDIAIGFFLFGTILFIRGTLRRRRSRARAAAQAGQNR